MADSSKRNETADDLDLEDGEIESDEEDEAPKDATSVSKDSLTIKNVASQNIVPNPTKNPFAQNPKNDTALSPLQTRDGVKDKQNDG